MRRFEDSTLTIPLLHYEVDSHFDLLVNIVPRRAPPVADLPPSAPVLLNNVVGNPEIGGCVGNRAKTGNERRREQDRLLRDSTDYVTIPQNYFTTHIQIYPL